MTWQIALLINILFSATRNTIQKRVLKGMDPSIFLIYVIIYMELIILPFYVIRYQSLPKLYPEMMLLGILFGLATTALFAAIKINLTQTSVFGSYRQVLPIILAAIFLGEINVLTAKAVTGIMVAFTALYLLTSGSQKKETAVTREWLYIIVAYIILDGSGQFWNKTFLVNHDVLETLNSQFIGEIPFLFVINKLRKQKILASFNQHLWIAADSLAEIGFAVFLLLALKLGPLSYVLPIQTIGTSIAGALVGLILYRELHLFNRRKIIGIIIGILGIVLIVI